MSQPSAKPRAMESDELTGTIRTLGTPRSVTRIGSPAAALASISDR
ncbi:MAG: hypothetical protein M3457_20800 [Chloroflexota bacterium]|nr:hypothetical protein [Chloroflexota bacterium]